MASTSSDMSHLSTRSEPVSSSTEVVARAATPAPQTSATPAPLPPQPERKPPLPQKQAPAPRPPRTQQSVFEQYALYGLAGKIVRTLAPHTEAQPEAILLQLLAAFGNIIGAGPHCMVSATRHSLNLFVVLVGESSKARKGTSWNQAVDPYAPGEEETSQPSESYGEQVLDSILKSIWTT